MGLEQVEIVLEVEDTFGISLPDSRASKICTVGDMCDCIVETLGSENEGEFLMRDVEKKLEEALQSIIPERVCREPIAANAAMGELFPCMGRRKVWRQLEIALDVKLPPLERPQWVRAVFLVVSIVLGWITGFLLLNYLFPHGANLKGWLIGVLSVFFGGMAIYFWWLVCLAVTWPLAIYWPEKIRTIGGLSEYVLKKRFGQVVKKGLRFNREEVWRILQSIVASVLDINPCKVMPESRFIEDLGAG